MAVAIHNYLPDLCPFMAKCETCWGEQFTLLLWKDAGGPHTESSGTLDHQVCANSAVRRSQSSRSSTSFRLSYSGSASLAPISI